MRDRAKRLLILIAVVLSLALSAVPAAADEGAFDIPVLNITWEE